nr:hypothetical protein [Tanacetum cinerariifolium]
MTNTRSGATMIRKTVNKLLERRVAEALDVRDATRNLKPLVEGGGEQEDGNGGLNGNRGNGNGGGNGNKNGNGRGGGNGHKFRVAEALEARDATRNLEPLVEGGGEQEEEMERTEIEGMEMEGIEIEEETEMKIVMGTKEEMVITSEVLCLLLESAHIKIS